jgi:hypothetical protein
VCVVATAERPEQRDGERRIIDSGVLDCFEVAEEPLGGPVDPGSIAGSRD